MKWLLIAIVLQTPVKTDLKFESLSACLQAEGEMRKAWTELFNRAIASQDSSAMSKAEKEKSRAFMTQQMTHGTCIPTQ